MKVAGLLSGTVTFLFTDIEGSTRRWEERPEVMGAALARHDELVHAAIATHNGAVFSGMGDGVAASFARATDAARAAMEIQAALADEAWAPALGPLRVRMGLHSGEAEVRDGSYYGSAVNRAARVMAIAWGGQVVCTATTASLIADDVELSDLGEHRLRDLSHPERVWQLGTSPAFPPLRSGSTLPGNLPTQVTEFVGRELELGNVRDAADTARIITLTGVGGAGKTRLALQFAAEAQPGFRHGAWLCELGPLTTSDAVEPLVAGVLGVEPGSGAATVATIVETIAKRQLLLVLDNCEHVLDTAATLAEAIVKSCPDVVVVATSREGLGVTGERILPVGSLGLPGVADPLAVARMSDAVQLFISRAQDVRPLTVDDDTVATIAQVCRRLDGIPLAIELAAARTQSLSVTEIAHLLDDRFKLLTRGARTAIGRHQTLRAAIDWSFDLLGESERRVLTRASVFAGGFTLEAAVAVCDVGSSTIDTLDLVDGLVRRSLLIAEEVGETTRYRMLETIRQYGEERLETAGEAVDVGHAHLDWCASFAREAGEQLRSPDDAASVARMERELDNFRAALHFAASVDDLDGAQRLLASAPIGALWDSRLGAAMASLAGGVAPFLGEPDHPVSAALLSLQALEAAIRFSGDEAVELAERACVISRRHDDWLRTAPWLALVLASLTAGRAEDLMAVAGEALDRAISEGDAFAVAEWQAELGIAHWMTGDGAEGQRLTEVGLALAEVIGADNLVMRNSFLRGASLLGPGSDPAAAMTYFDRAMKLGERVGGNLLFGGAAWAVLLSGRGASDLSADVLARELAENLPTPMFLMDAALPAPMMIFYNDAAAALLGRSFAADGPISSVDFGAQLSLMTADGEYLARRDSAAGVAFLQRRPAHQTLTATPYDGVRRTFETTAHPLFGTTGEFLGVVCVFWNRRDA